MTQNNTITLDNVGAVTLAGEIIKQAKMDYIMAMCYKDEEEIPAPDYGIHGELKTPLQPALVVRDDLEDFVRSEWFSILSMNTADPTTVLISWLEDAKLWWTAQMLGENRRKMMPKLRHRSCIDKRIAELKLAK